MPDAEPNLMTLFAEALARTEPAERAAYLDIACAGDAPLRRRIEALLAAHDGAGRFLEGDDAGSSETTPPTNLQTASESDLETRPPSQPATQRHGSDGTIPGTEDAKSTTGKVIAGRYTLRGVLGEGGMGTVYRAEQTDPVRRPVALKLIKIGMDSH